jgi:hypothetical protein
MISSQRSDGRVGITSSIARVEPKLTLVSLSTTDFRWIHQDAWGDVETGYFYAQWPTSTAGIMLPPAFVRNQYHHPKLVFAGRWILSQTGVGWIGGTEVQVLQSSFSQAFIGVSPCDAEGGWLAPKSLEALSLFVSGVIMMTKADTVHLIPTTQAVEEQISSLSWGQVRRVWTPRAGFGWGKSHDEESNWIVTTVLDPYEWWQTEGGQAGRRTLSYLEKRISFGEMKDQPCTPRKSGLMQRLSRLLRWS